MKILDESVFRKGPTTAKAEAALRAEIAQLTEQVKGSAKLPAQQYTIERLAEIAACLQKLEKLLDAMQKQPAPKPAPSKWKFIVHRDKMDNIESVEAVKVDAK